MASVSIPWHDGPGNIVLTFTGQGNGTVTVTSDTNWTGPEARQQVVTFVVTDGCITLGMKSSNGSTLKSSSGSTLRCKDRSMKVAVTVIQKTGRVVLKSSQEHVLRSFNGNRLVTLPATA